MAFEPFASSSSVSFTESSLEGRGHLASPFFFDPPCFRAPVRVQARSQASPKLDRKRHRQVTSWHLGSLNLHHYAQSIRRSTRTRNKDLGRSLRRLSRGG